MKLVHYVEKSLYLNRPDSVYHSTVGDFLVRVAMGRHNLGYDDDRIEDKQEKLEALVSRLLSVLFEKGVIGEQDFVALHDRSWGVPEIKRITDSE